MISIHTSSSTVQLFNKLLLCTAVAATLPMQAAFAETSQSLKPYSFATTSGRLPKNVIPRHNKVQEISLQDALNELKTLGDI